MNKGQIRTRFAPSPTGFLHIGGLRTALYDYLIAKKSGGTFLLRIEDTDQSRLVEGATEKILKGLKWAGIEPEEGVVGVERGSLIQKGDCGPYVQSQRLNIYSEYAKTLLDKGYAYHCFCSPQRLEELRAKQQSAKQAPKYDKHCKNIGKKEVEKRIANGEKYVVRLNVPAGETIEFNDGVYGKVSVNSDTIDDQVLIKSDGYPTYHFAVVVDDHLMGITHVTRGEEWLPSTPKHILLYKYFGWKIPEIVHFPNVQGENRKKLSKRQGDVSVEDFIKKGYLPEAIVNFIVLLGWNPKNEQEYFSIEELKEVFDVEGLNKSGAIFDFKKLDWMNSHYIKKLDDQELEKRTLIYLKEYCSQQQFEFDEGLAKKIITIEKERIKKFSEITKNIDFYYKTPDIDPTILPWKKCSYQCTADFLQKSKDVITGISVDDFTKNKLEKKLLIAAGDEKGELLWPLRVALTGEKYSPSPFEVAWAIGKNETIKRVDLAINSLLEKSK